MHYCEWKFVLINFGIAYAFSLFDIQYAIKINFDT